MKVEEKMKILEEINKEIIIKGRLLYSYEIKEILDRFIVKEAGLTQGKHDRPKGEWSGKPKSSEEVMKICKGNMHNCCKLKYRQLAASK